MHFQLILSITLICAQAKSRLIEQDALKWPLKRVENLADKNTYNHNRQYKGEDHLVGIESFHEQIELTLMLQESRMSQISTRRVVLHRGLVFSVQPKCSM
jgi:hypothetical protein